MKHYCLNCGYELHDNQLICPKCKHCIITDMVKSSSGEKLIDKAGMPLGSVLSAQQIEVNTQWSKYRCGKDGLAGHGFAAEDANAFNDIIWSENVEFSGRDNSKNGADRVVNGQGIQTKYYSNAEASVRAAFNSETGMYKYEGQVLEVPRDQYDEAVSIMRKRIAEGKVEGIIDPNDATKIVKQGSVTYQQAKNIAKAGNIDSLVFDAKTQAVSAVSAFGISFLITAGLGLIKCRKNEEDTDFVIQSAFLQGVKTGTISLASGVITMQFLRTQFGRNFAAILTKQIHSGIKGIRSADIGKTLIDRIATTIQGKPLYGAAAGNVTTKFLRTNTIGNAVMLTVITMPDMYRCFIGNSVSKPQFLKNLIVNTTSITGATVGAFFGSALGPWGTIGGGLAGGALLSLASKAIADKISEDDSEKMKRLLEVALMQLSHDYLIQDENEFSHCIELITKEKAISSKFMRALYSVGADDDNDELRVQIAYNKLEHYFSVVARQRNIVDGKRKHIKINDDMVLSSINKLNDVLDTSIK